MKKLVIFAGHNENNIIDDYVVYYIKELKKSSDIIYISDDNILDTELEKISGYCVHIINKQHNEYYFGSYKRGYFYAEEKNILKNYDYLIFANDSHFGPIYPLETILDKIEYKKNVIYGIFKNIEMKNPISNIPGLEIIPEHLKTHFILVPKEAFLTEWFNTFFLRIRELPENGIILHYEYGLSKLFKEHDFILSGIFEGSYDLNFDNFFNLLTNGYPFFYKYINNIPFKKFIKMLNLIDKHYDVSLFENFYKKEPYNKFITFKNRKYLSIFTIFNKSIFSIKVNFNYFIVSLLIFKFSFKNKYKYNINPYIISNDNKIYFSILDISNFSLFSLEKFDVYYIIKFFGIKLSIKTNLKLNSQTNTFYTNTDYTNIKNDIFCIKKNILEIRNSNKKKNNKVVYTCITNGYDDLLLFSYIDDNWDYICFTDNENLISNKVYGNWIIRPLEFSKLDGIRNNRWHKLHPDILFPDYEESIYIDSNINIKSNYLFKCVENVIQKENAKISIPIHGNRCCIYQEFDAVTHFKKDKQSVLDEQKSIYKKDGFPIYYGLTENNCIYRKHKDEEVISLMKDWWYWIENYSKRDQLSLFYVLWKHNYNMPYLTHRPIRYDPDNFEFFNHKK